MKRFSDIITLGVLGWFMVWGNFFKKFLWVDWNFVEEGIWEIHVELEERDGMRGVEGSRREWLGGG